MQIVPSEWRRSKNPALIEDGVVWSYAALGERVDELSAKLPKHRSLVFCFCRTDSATVCHYLACLAAGHAVALLDAGMAADHRQRLIERYRPEIVLGLEKLELTDEKCRSEAGEIHRDLSVLLPTSGTTGNPKFVRLSARNVVTNADSIRQALSITPADRAMCSLPLHYSYGLSVLNSHLRAGASVVLTGEGLLSARFWEACRQQRCTSMAGVPYTYYMLKRLGLENLNIPDLRTLTQAGGKLAPELISEFHNLLERRSGRFFVMYGQTEATARMSVLPDSDLPAKIGSVGLPVPGGGFEIEDSEIVYSGPNVMLGYAETREDLRRGDEMQGRLRTGDLGRMDSDGYLYISGRIKREAKVAGYRVNLDDLEGLLRMHGPTAAVAGSEKIRLFCEWGDEAAYRLATTALVERLRFGRQAFEFRRVPALPVSSSGKVDYAALMLYDA